MRIAIVNDMHMAVMVLQEMISKMESHELAWIAENGVEAVKQCEKDVPDLILMDLIMPEMNGVDATRHIMNNTPCAILIVTSSIITNAHLVFDAMGAGALDAVCTPIVSSSHYNIGDNDIVNKIDQINKLLSSQHRISKLEKPNELQKAESAGWLIAIGSSTGGPSALSNLLGELPDNINAAIVIIQHIDKSFAPGLVDWLNERSKYPVVLAKEGDLLTRGKIWVAGTNDHLILDINNRLRYVEEPVDNVFRPSVDVFFNSIVTNSNTNMLGVLLTGMGSDGANGLLGMRNAGAYTIAQDEKTCAVYGMPKEAAKLNAAVDVLPLPDIAARIVEVTTSKFEKVINKIK
jgi:chemotaxis response regulator CheB